MPVIQPHKCECFSGFCWKNLCKLKDGPKPIKVTDPVATNKKRRLKSKAELLREQIRVYSAKPNDSK